MSLVKKVLKEDGEIWFRHYHCFKLILRCSNWVTRTQVQKSVRWIALPGLCAGQMVGPVDLIYLGGTTVHY